MTQSEQGALERRIAALEKREKIYRSLLTKSEICSRELQAKLKEYEDFTVSPRQIPIVFDIEEYALLREVRQLNDLMGGKK